MGRNIWVKQLREKDGDLVDGKAGTREINIGGKATVWMGKGDKLVIETPGGGAWGALEGEELNTLLEHEHVAAWEPRGSIAERSRAQAAF